MTTPSRFGPRGRLVAAHRPVHELLDEFAQSLVGLAYEDITVLAATAQMGSWTDDNHVYVQLVISDPPAGRETWPVAALREIRMETRRRAADAGIEQFVDVGTTGGPDHDPEPGLPPGPSRARIATSEERSAQA
jgi:hypothetical protein